jgi:GDP-4-dehydro-6-deoxy-D-mannose reductase
MPPRRILLTGASGFVAGHLIPRLRVAFPDAELTLCGLGAVDLDVTNTDAVHALVREIRPDACVHLAAVSTVQGARHDPGHAWRVNLHGSLALATAVLAHVPECVFLYVSSGEIYGRSFRAGIALDETAAPAPMNLYAATKAAADLALGAMLGEGLRVIRLRPFNHTGPGQTADFAVPAFARQAARIAAGVQPPVLQVGALDPERDFLDVRDVCSAYVACLERADWIAPGTIFNIASGVPRRIGDILQQVLDLAGVAATLETGATLLRPAEIPRAAGNADAAREALGWRPAIAWEQTLRDVLNYWLQSPPDQEKPP